MAKVAPNNWTTVALHKRETAGSGYWGHPGICTVTFCEGDPAVAFATLKTRCREVIDANPWVAGRFLKKALIHPPTGSDELVSEMVTMCKVPGVSRTTPYKALVKATGMNPDVAVTNAKKIQKSNSLITKVTVVEPQAAGGEFAIVFSMSHSAADGHDYGDLYISSITGPDYQISSITGPDTAAGRTMRLLELTVTSHVKTPSETIT